MASNLFVRRLYVLTRLGQVAYDERFHHGVNIIRGDNSSGKSTITHLLFYALGGEFTRFVPQVRLCSRVLAEVALGGAVVTLERPLDQDGEGRVKPRQGMRLHWGTLDEALDGRCKSLALGYVTTAGRQGFSAALFHLMDMPAVQADCNITMHQLLRLMYVDQESPTSSVFLHEPFDRQTTREAVADLLMGVYDSSLYEAKARLRELEADITDARAILRSTEATLPRERRTCASVEALIGQKREEIKHYAREIARVRAGEHVDDDSGSLLARQKDEVAALAREQARLEEQADLLGHEVDDTVLYVSELASKRDALLQSSSARRVLGSLRLNFCPECLSPLPDEVPEGTCRLCKSPVDDQDGRTQARRMAEEIALQIRESEDSLRSGQAELRSLRARLRGLRRKHQEAQRALDDMLGTARGSVAGLLEDLNYRRGRAQGELLQYYTLLEQAEYYEGMTRRLAALGQERTRTEAFIQERTAQQDHRRAQVGVAMQEHGVYFLHRDQESQRAFASAQPADLHIDFGNDRVYLQQPHDRLSASSSFFLKLVARFALFFASLDIPWMRYPRFILVDNMEDKGIEPGRAQKFQRTLIERLGQYPTDSYQVIYTTSYITPDLDRSPYVVGDHYGMGHKSLSNV